MRRRKQTRKTDYGTIVFHWFIAGSFVVLVITGFRIGAETPGRTWINDMNAFVPPTPVWTWHMKAAVVLMTTTVAYTIYLPLTGLIRRIRFDRVRLTGLLGASQARWGAINIALYWVFFIALAAEIITGALVYLGAADYTSLSIHWYAMWVLLAYTVCHVFAHWCLGGIAQLIRVLRPSAITPPPPAFDPTELLALVDEQSNKAPASHPASFNEHPSRAHEHLVRPSEAASMAYDVVNDIDSTASEMSSDSARPRREQIQSENENEPFGGYSPGPRHRVATFQANPFVVATASAMVGIGFLLAIEENTPDTLHIQRVSPAEVPIVDGDASDPIWRKVPPLRIVTESGANFDGKGETTIEVRAVHNGINGFFLFVWDDPTRSLKHLPLIKETDGWHVLHRGYETGDERAYSEDKFSVLFTTLNVTIAGDRTFHAGPRPVTEKPPTLHGRGLHYTTQEGVYADVWLWHATSNAPFGVLDDGYFGTPRVATPEQQAGAIPYRGGYAPDPGSTVYIDNFDGFNALSHQRAITPRRLPIDTGAMSLAIGPLDLDPNHSDGERTRWYMAASESVPYSKERDDLISVGTVIPGVVIIGEPLGDRADVRCAAKWAAGRWALEVTRPLEARSQFDIPIASGIFMRVSAFDHAQIAHTRHVRPIKLELE